MNKDRSYVFGTVVAIALVSCSLWLVPGAVRRAFDETGEFEGIPLRTTFKQAAAQVDSALQAYGKGIRTGDVEQALIGFDTGDAAGASLVARTLLTPVICGLVAGLILRGVEASLSGPGSPVENLCRHWPLAALVLVVLLNALGPVLVVQHWYLNAGM